MAELIIHAGKLQGRRLVLPEREVIVGRDEDCHLRLTSTLVSRQHCALKTTAEGIWVRDLGSQNGTYVNDVAVTAPLLLKPGDMLRVGAALFQVPEGKTAVPRVAPKKDDSRISDADIADWLSDQDMPSGVAPADTTVIKGRQSAPPDLSAVTTTPTEPRSTAEPRNPVLGRQQPRSLKDEAADIIRRHWETVRAKQP